MNVQQIVDEINSLDFRDIGSWPNWAHIAAIVLLCIAVAGAGYWFVIKKQIEDLDRAKKEEPQLRQTFETKQRKVANLDAYREQLAEMEKRFGAMLLKLPSKSEVANLLSDISQTRVETGLDEELFRPKGEIKRDFYAELPNDLQVTGSYHEFGNFASEIAKLGRIVTLHKVNITPTGPGQLRMSVVATTYRYLDEEELTQ